MVKQASILEELLTGLGITLASLGLSALAFALL